MREIVVFSGSAHRELAKHICAELAVELSPVEIKRFSNDCLQAQLLANCRQRDVYIVQPLVPPTQEHLMERSHDRRGTRGLRGPDHRSHPALRVRPLRQKDASRISSVAVSVADMLVAAGVDRVLTMTLHAPQVHGFFSVPVDHLTAIGVLAEHFRTTTSPTHRGVSRPRQRQDRHPVLPAPRAARGSRQQAVGDDGS